MFTKTIIKISGAALIFLSACTNQTTVSSDQITQVTKTAVSAKSEQQCIPCEIVNAFYAGQGQENFWSDDPQQRAKLLSESLAISFTDNEKKFGELMITFDPFVNGQDALISDLQVNKAVIDTNRALVPVRFKNFSQDNLLVYSFVLEDSTWKLDEIAAIGGEARWTLTEVLFNP